MMNMFPGQQVPASMEWLGALAWLLIPLALLDLALKGWALWRAAHMEKNIWFIALLLVNSMGILPGIFLLMTNTEYQKKILKK